MLGLRQRARAGRARSAAAGAIRADLTGATVHGPVAIGEHIVQIHAEHGAVVNYLPPDERPVPELRRPPPRRPPRDFPGLLGRGELVAAVQEAVASGAAVELHGPEGIGKTSLLRHVGNRIEPGEAERGLVHLSCRRLPVDDVLQLLFESFYDCAQVIVPTPAQLSDWLREPRAVVLLDDLGLDRDDVGSLLETAAGCQFLWAGEERRLWGEGRSFALAELDRDAALELFERQLARPLADDERAAIEALCGAIANPLAILQAAALVREGATGAAGLAAAAGEELEARIVGSLGARQRAALAPLSALRGAALDTERVGGASGLDDAAEVLAGLEERGLVAAQSPRYVARRAASALTVEGDGIASEAESLGAVIGELRRWLEGRPEPRSVAAAGDSILAAIDAGIDSGRVADALAVARAADPGLAAAGRWGSWGAALERAQEAARAIGDEAAEAWALHELGSRALGRGETDTASSALEAALGLRERLGDADGAAITRHNLDLLFGGPPGPPDPSGGGPPGWLAPAGLAVVAAAAIAVGVVALAGGDDQPAPVRELDVAEEAEATPEDAAASDDEPAPSPEGEQQPPVLEPDPVDFGQVELGGEYTAELTATNPGEVPIALQSPRLDPASGFDVAADGCSEEALAPGASCRVVILFVPREARAYEAELPVQDSGGAVSTSVALVGSAVSAPKTDDDVGPPVPTTPTTTTTDPGPQID